MRYFMFLFLVTANAVAQRSDSVLLKTVTIYGIPDEKYLAGSSVTEIDSLLFRYRRDQHLGDLLSLQFPVYFRSYGNGMISGISMRGTTPQHTAVLWNGINISSFSLGQADFSILPSVAFDKIHVHEGAGSARFGSGAFGGTVLLSSETEADNHLVLSQNVSSFQNFFSSLEACKSFKNFSFSVKGYRQSSENNFPVQSLNRDQPHAAFSLAGAATDLKWDVANGKSIQLHYWFHKSEREIQPPIGVTSSDDFQNDNNHRLSLQFLDNNRFGLLKVNTGFVRDEINYNGDVSVVSRRILKASEQFRIFKSINAEAGAEANLITGKIKQYNGGIATDHRYDLFASFFYNASERLSLSLNLRQPFVSGFNSPFLPYLGVDYDLTKSKSLSLTGNVSRNFRAPTLNDRYWQDAGSRSLLPEKSYAAEGGLKLNFKEVTLKGVGFRQEVDGWIQWEPRAGGNFVPTNLTHVSVRGVACNATYFHRFNRLLLRSFMNWQFSHSTITEASPQKKQTIGKQLIYTPTQTVSANIFLTVRKSSVILSSQYTGKRFDDTSNADVYALPAIALFDVSFSKYVIAGHHRIDGFLSVKNLFNTEYQLYSGRAMPGRNYSFQINYQLNPK